MYFPESIFQCSNVDFNLPYLDVHTHTRTKVSILFQKSASGRKSAVASFVFVTGYPLGCCCCCCWKEMLLPSLNSFRTKADVVHSTHTSTVLPRGIIKLQNLLQHQPATGCDCVEEERFFDCGEFVFGFESFSWWSGDSV